MILKMIVESLLFIVYTGQEGLIYKCKIRKKLPYIRGNLF